MLGTPPSHVSRDGARSEASKREGLTQVVASRWPADQGQGASLAFEDAEGLAHLFCSGPTTPGADQVPNLLARFTALRKERVHMVQEVSRRMAKPAAYDRGEVLNALRFASKVLTYRGMEELEKGIAENGGQAGSERSKLEATEKAHRLRSGAGVKQE